MNPWLVVLIALALVAGFVGVQALFFIWLERKICGRMQDRLGPTRVGGRYGWLQTIADGVKLLQKEDLIPVNGDRVLFRAAPYVVMVGSICAYVALPFADGWVAQNLNVAVFYMLAIMSLEVVGVILAGYSSGNKWSLLGGMREAAQVVSYEVPMAICVVIPVMISGTMNLNAIAGQQKGMLWNWYLFHSPPMFLAGIVYFICATASVKRAPFYLAEAESELVAGFHTEYSGMRWSFFFMAEYASMFAVSGIFAILFLGGWNGPVPIFSSWVAEGGFFAFIGNLFGLVNFMTKCVLMILVMIWLRWTLPRLRIDQVMMTCLKYLLPISCALLLLTAGWEIAFPQGIVSGILHEMQIEFGNAGGFPLDEPSEIGG